MSRIILAQHPGTDEHHIVVGWDRPVASYFWQEFNQEPQVIEQNGGWVVKNGDNTSPIYKTAADAEEHKWDDEWEEMKAYGGYGLNELPTINDLLRSTPVKIVALLTPEVQKVLEAHAMDPDTGRVSVTMIPTSFKVEVQTYGHTGTWSTNAVRFATLDEADKAGVDMAHRWTMLENWRVAPSDDAVNYKWEDGKAVAV